MRKAAGQAIGDVAKGWGAVVRALLQFAFATLVVMALGIVLLGVRLSQGPLEIAWLTQRLAQMVNAESSETKLSIASVAIAWEGLGGVDHPIDIIVRGVGVETAAGIRIADIPSATVSLGFRALLRGRVVLRAVDLEGVRLQARRAQDGRFSLDLGDFSAVAAPDADLAKAGAAPPVANILQALSGAGTTEAYGLWSDLRRLRLHNASLAMADTSLGLQWTATGADLDMIRAADGGASGSARLGLALQGETVTLQASLALLKDGGGLTVKGTLSPLVPARLARAAPVLGPLAMLDASVTLAFAGRIDGAMALSQAMVQAKIGPGTVYLGEGVMPIREAVLQATVLPDRLDARLERLVLQARPEAEPTTIAMSLAATRAQGLVHADITVDLDQVAFADLPALWPVGIGGPGTRPWITQNLTAGKARSGHVTLRLQAPEDFSDAVLLSIAGGMDASDITAHWLRPVPPIEHGEAKVVFVDPDTLDVIATSGTQAATKLALRSARVRFTGLAGHDQFIAIDSQIAGPFADTLQLLRHPKIKLLDRRPLALRDPAGDINTRLTVALPLKNDLDIDNVALHAVGTLTGGHLGGIAAGRDLDRAMLTVDVGNDGLTLSGTADIAAIPTQLKVEMDFRPGAASQILQKVSATATADQKQLLAAGLNTQGVVAGPLGLAVSYQQRRDGAGDATLKVDLTRAALDGGRVRWTKPAGRAGTLEASVTLLKDRLVSIRSLRAEAPDLQLQASGDVSGGMPSVLRVQRLVIGGSTRLGGSVRLPARAGLPYDISLVGPALDLSGELDRKTLPAVEPPEQPGPAFTLDARVDRVLLSPGRELTSVAVKAENDGVVTRTARVSGQSGAAPGLGAFTVTIDPLVGGRSLNVTSEDAGTLLQALDVMDDMRGGRLLVRGRFDDTRPGHPLSGQAEINDFRIQNAPAIGRLLQGMSLYGLLEVAQGVGLGFTRLVAPFTYQAHIMTLADARAYSASLGLTAKGTMDLRRHVADVEGTVIPAYALNTALGRLPLVGRLFSPEEGGGLFAVSFNIRGVFEDPAVVVNPLSALTPGILRGFFDIFDRP